ncbi:hypothetical protein GCM10010168_41000 [Actinoplanes ianthinogenes]|uniref:Glycosyltransferase RgtA/B/C/D-like domain-containing protein n=1 Tax=Actinoplanes ianthinogenes TaxID=122358 RepID=A0ABM7LWN8_9ACTN|nr:hypothetical protein Aiant_42470 [Actinoplanes ianthinogenes]GGR19014.1 hypothetical protein GCM10010168_41000 [Actinoplanes ianthinogenes]
MTEQPQPLSIRSDGDAVQGSKGRRLFGIFGSRRADKKGGSGSTEAEKLGPRAEQIAAGAGTAGESGAAKLKAAVSADKSDKDAESDSAGTSSGAGDTAAKDSAAAGGGEEGSGGPHGSPARRKRKALPETRPPGAPEDPWTAFTAIAAEKPPGRIRRGFRAVRRTFVHEYALAAYVSAVLAIGLTWPTLRYPLHTLPQDLGDPSRQAWQVSWLGHVLRTNPVKLWQSNAYFPNPNSFAYGDSLLGYAGFGLVGDGPGAAVLRYNILFVLAHALLLFGAYALVRQLGARPMGAAVAAAAFAYAPWRLAQEGHLDIISAGAIPLALALLARGHGWSLRYGFRPDRRRAAWAALGWVVATWQLSLGFSLGLPFAYVLAGVVLFLLVGVPVRRIRRRWREKRREKERGGSAESGAAGSGAAGSGAAGSGAAGSGSAGSGSAGSGSAGSGGKAASAAASGKVDEKDAGAGGAGEEAARDEDSDKAGKKVGSRGDGSGHETVGDKAAAVAAEKRQAASPASTERAAGSPGTAGAESVKPGPGAGDAGKAAARATDVGEGAPRDEVPSKAEARGEVPSKGEARAEGPSKTEARDGLPSKAGARDGVVSGPEIRKERSAKKDAAHDGPSRDESGEDDADLASSGKAETGEDESGKDASGKDVGESAASQDAGGRGSADKSESGESKPGESKVAAGKAGDEKPGEGKADKGEAGGGEVGESKPGENEAAGGKARDAGGDKTGGDKAGSEKADGGKAGDSKPDDKPDGGKTGDSKAVDDKADGGKAADSKPDGSKAADSKTGGGATGGNKTGGGKAGGGKAGRRWAGGRRRAGKVGPRRESRAVLGWRLLVANVLGVLFFLGVGAVIAIPYLRAPDSATRSTEIDFFSPPVRSLLIGPAESRIWGAAHATPRASLAWPAEMSLLPGFVLYALALAGLIFSIWRWRQRLVLVLSLAAAVILTLGTKFFGGRWTYLPLFGHFPASFDLRISGRLMLWTTLLLAVLAAGAIDEFVRRIEHFAAQRTPPWPSPWLRMATTIPLLLVVLEGWNATAHPVVPVQPAALRTVGGPMLVLPTAELSDQTVQLWSTSRYQQVTNGGGIVAAANQAEMRQKVTSFPDLASIQYLREKGVGTVLLIRSEVVGTPWEQAGDLPVDALGIRREDLPDAVVFRLS